MSRRPTGNRAIPACLSAGAFLAVATLAGCENDVMEPEENRPPEAAFMMTENNGPTAIVPDSMLVGDSVTSAIGDLFTDPDGDDLTLEVASLFPELMRASMMPGDTLLLQALARGTAGVRVTASDPDSASASLTFLVIVSPDTTVTPPPAVFKSTFTSANEGWQKSTTVEEAYLSNGFLHVKDDYGTGTANKDLDKPYVEWEIHTTMARTSDVDGAAPDDGDVAGVEWGGEKYGNSYAIRRFRFEIGPVHHFTESVNFALLAEGPFPNDWVVVPAGSGYSDHVSVDQNADNDVVISLRGGRLVVSVNDYDVVNIRWPDNADPRLDDEVGAYTVAYYYANETAGGRWDYYEVYGEEWSADTQTQTTGVTWNLKEMVRIGPRER